MSRKLKNMNQLYKSINESKKDKPKGVKNKTINQKFVELTKLTQKEMKKYLSEELKKYYKNIISKDGFLYVKGNEKIALTAHMDTTKTVNCKLREPVKDFYEEKIDGKHVISSPQGIGGDDRCGIYVILKILETTDYRPTIIFNEDEEIGCIGSKKFKNSKFIKDLEDLYFIVQIDRRGRNDAVFYQDTNEDFHKFVTESTGYIEKSGSYTDICQICPACKVAGVNLSSGYYNEHTEYESVILEELENTYEATKKLIKDGIERKEQFEYKERKYDYSTFRRFAYDDFSDTGYFRTSYFGTYNDRYENAIDYLREYNEKEKNKRKKSYTYQTNLYIVYQDGEDEYEECYTGKDENEAFVNFFIENPTLCWNNILDYYEDEELVEDI